jgi:hypothetical protein
VLSFGTTHDEELALADQHIAEAEARITRQHLLIARLAAGHLGTSMAEALLATLKRSLATMHTHRQTILAEIAGELPD